jgi:hypothetical protein
VCESASCVVRVVWCCGVVCLLCCVVVCVYMCVGAIDVALHTCELTVFAVFSFLVPSFQHSVQTEDG